MLKLALELEPGDVIEIEGENRMVELTYASERGICVTLAAEGVSNYDRDHVIFKARTEIVVF